MKKLLALVLALVMVLSLCVVSSNAAFTDAADIEYKEAADVMQAVNVFVGDGTGNFYPKANLTREQAAKVIAYLDLGEDVAEALPAIGTFSDVSDWADKYVDYCANAGIVNGIGNGMFGGANQVTGYEFAKMLLVVLGFDAEIEGMTGSAWQIGVAKLSKEFKIAKGYKTNLAAPLTREAAAKLAFNAIQSKYVKQYNYNGGFTIVNNELSYNAKGTYELAGTKDAAGNYTSYELFFEPHWSGDDDLVKETPNSNGVNSFGRPTHTWKYQNKKIGTYTDEPVLTFNDKIKYADLYTQILEAGYKFDTDKSTDINVSLRTTLNGVDQDEMINGRTYTNADGVVPSGDTLKDFVTAKQSDKTYANVEGMFIEVFADSDGYVTNIAKVVYVLGEVSSITADKASTTLKDERALTFTFDDVNTISFNETVTTDNGCNATDGPAGFDEVFAAVKKEDKVLVAIGYEKNDAAKNPKVIGVALPTLVEGTISFASSTKATIAGESLKVATSCLPISFAAKKTYKAWTDANGYVYATNANAVDANAYGILKVYTSFNSDGENVPMAYIVKADGTTDRIEIQIDERNAAKSTYDVLQNMKGEVAFLEESSNVYSLWDENNAAVTANASVKKVTADIVDKAKRVTVGSTNYVFADGYQIVYLSTDTKNNGKFTASSKLQDVNVSDTDSTVTGTLANVYAVVNSDNKVTTLFVEAAANTVVKDAKSLIFVADYTGYGTDVDENDKSFPVYYFDAFADGEKVEGFTALDTDTESLADLKSGAVKGLYGFYMEAKDSDKNDYYKLNTYGLPGNDKNYAAAYGTLTKTLVENDAFVTIDFNTTPATSIDLNVTGDTVVVSTSESIEIASYDDIQANLETNEYTNLSVAALYDKDTLDILYLYVYDAN